MDNEQNPMNLENFNQEALQKLSGYEQQMNQLQQQIESIKQANKEIVGLSEDIEQLKGKKDKEIFAHIGRGVFAKAKLLSEDLVVDVGGRRFVEKDIDQTKELIQKQVKRLEDAEKEINQTLQQIQNEMMKIISENFKGSENLQSS